MSTKQKPQTKYITIPEMRPLWAMNRCYGPTHGPLNEPTPTPIPIIGELLRQTGKEALTINEVIPTGNVKGAKWSSPVRLTLDNYTLPYDVIAGNPPKTPSTVLSTPGKRPDAEPVAATPLAKTTVVDTTTTTTPALNVADDNTEEKIELPDETVTQPVTTVNTAVPTPTVIVDSTNVQFEAEVKDDPDSGDAAPNIPDGYTPEQWAAMSKKERKTARREAREKAMVDAMIAERETSTNATTTSAE